MGNPKPAAGQAWPSGPG